MAIPALFGNVDPNQQNMTQEEIKRRRAMAQQLIGENSGFEPLAHPLQAVAKVLGAGVGAYKENKASKAQGDFDKRRREGWGKLLTGMDTSTAPASMGMPSGGMPSSPMSAMPASPAGGAMAAASGAAIPTGDRASYIRSGLVNRGLPEHVADAFLVNFKDESGLDSGINEAKPLVPGSRGGFGLYQLTGPRRREYEAFAGQRGVNPSDIDAQLDFMMGELGGSERRAGERILSAPDTATAAQAIVNDFLRPSPAYARERANRYAGLGGSAQRQTQVASLDPSAGVEQATSQRQYQPGNVLESQVPVYDRQGLRMVDAAEYERQARASQLPNPNVRPYSGPGASIDMAPQSPMGPPMTVDMKMDAQREQLGINAIPLPASAPMAQAPAPQQGGGAQAALMSAFAGGSMQPQPQQAPMTTQGALQSRMAPMQAPMQATAVNAPMGMPQQAQQQQMMAQLLTGGQQPTQPSGPDRALIAQLLNDPATEDLGQSMLMQMMQQQQQMNDPMRQLEMQKAQLELQALQNPQAEPEWQELPNGDYGYFDQSTRQFTKLGSAVKAEPGYRLLSAEEAQQMQLPPGAYQVDGQNKISQVGGGGTTINLPGQPNIGTIPPGYQAVQDQAGAWSMAPIPGGPAAAEAAAAATAKSNRESAQVQRSGLVAEEIDRALGLMEGGVLPDTGVGAMLSGVPGTDAKAISTLLDTIKANIGFDELNKMRQQSVTGGALGNVTERELQFLQAVAGSLDQAQGQEQLTYNLNRLWNGYQDVIHGEGKGPERRELAPAGDSSNPIELDEVVVPSGWEEDWDYLTPEEKQRVLGNG